MTFYEGDTPTLTDEAFALLREEQRLEVEKKRADLAKLEAMTPLEYLAEGIWVSSLLGPSMQELLAIQGVKAIWYDDGKPSWKVLRPSINGGSIESYEQVSVINALLNSNDEIDEAFLGESLKDEHNNPHTD